MWDESTKGSCQTPTWISDGLATRCPQTQWAWAGFFFHGIAQAVIQLLVYYMTEKIVNAEVLIFNL